MSTLGGQTGRMKTPKQRRSQATLERFVDAARRLLAEKPFDEIAVNEIVLEAEASVGAFYARFGDKEALLEHLRGVVTSDASDEIRRVLASRDWETAPLETVAREIVRVLVGQHRAHTGTLRALASRKLSARAKAVPGGNPVAQPLPALVDLIKRRRAEISHPNPDVAVHLGLGMVASAVRDRILFPELSAASATLSPVTDDVFVDELTRAFLGFLGVKTTGGAG